MIEHGTSATVRVVEATEGVETLSGEYTVSTDDGLTYSAPADVDGGASALETAVEQAIGRMAHATDLTATDTTVTDAGNLLRGCGFAYDVEFPAGRDFPPLQTNTSSFDVVNMMGPFPLSIIFMFKMRPRIFPKENC